MKIFYYISTGVLVASMLLLLLCMFDIVRLSDALYRATGVVCLVAVFCTVNSYIRLYRATRKF